MDERVIRQWYDVFKDGHELTEVRILPSGKKGGYSGYFTDVETLIQSISRYDDCNIYFTLNKINDACYSREQRDRISERPKATTSDNDIVGRDWCLIDIDVNRPSDTNSTDEELMLAKQVGNEVFTFLRDNGFEKPVCCLSGNGVHLLLKQAMKNTPENTDTMKRFLLALDMLFSTEKVKIDTSTFNASRICKLYGCTSRKGSANDPLRPQRMSTILSVPDEVKATPNEYFEKVAKMLPEEEKPNRLNGWSQERFDLDSFIAEHDIQIHSKSRFGSGWKYVLEECPFNSSHRAPDSALFLLDNGAIGFKCLHNSCQQYTWHDFRLHYDPQAYEQKDYYNYQQKRQYYSKVQTEEEIQEESKGKGKKWLAMSDIQWIDPSKLPYLPTGIRQLDKKIMGLLLGDVTIISGLSGAGKTSLIDWVALNIIQKGYKVAIWSGELQGFRFQAWIDQMAAGKNFVKPKEGYDDLYFAPKMVCEKVNTWLEDKLWLFNNAYGNKWTQLFSDIKDITQKKDVKLVVIDNLMALDIDSYNGEKNDRQTAFINELKDYAKQSNIHVILVCHPRKEQSFQLLRKESIAGTADLTNLADNVLIIHRVGRDFVHRGKDFYGEDVLAQFTDFDVVLECVKNRSVGVQDYLVGLHYEKESRRLKNDIAEYLIYDWQEQTRQVEFDDMPDFTSNEFTSQEEDLPY